MGQDWRPDEAVSPKLMKALLRLVKDKIPDAEELDTAAHCVTARALFVSLYVFFLKGNEGLLSDLKGLRDEFDAGRSQNPPYSTQALLGHFKVDRLSVTRRVYNGLR